MTEEQALRKRTVKRRSDRLSQRRHRTGKRSYVTEIENLQIIVAWMSGDLSEGQAARALGVDRVSARVMRDDMIDAGITLWEIMARREAQPSVDKHIAKIEELAARVKGEQE